ncbi:hypothetical protein P3H15_44335 [Rhodococcus sp. T2V]|uniref:hypothetical protein n=1 Tax=Rhodococcus sp. T2V TaxID=3034164 RepID=UPI0023E2475A|nr:hypothetical protein [Rhodococcus sp. T2V]MDF3312007.1 hypothetical protein [Rhodococcus sp. T2V]
MGTSGESGRLDIEHEVQPHDGSRKDLRPRGDVELSGHGRRSLPFGELGAKTCDDHADGGLANPDEQVAGFRSIRGRVRFGNADAEILASHPVPEEAAAESAPADFEAGRASHQ